MSRCKGAEAGSSPDRPSGQEVGDGDSADLDAVDDQRHILPGLEDFAQAVLASPGVGVDLNLAVDQVDDPVHRDPAAGVGHLLLASVAVEGALRDLDEQTDVPGTGQSYEVVIER